METITIQLEPEIADAYRTASPAMQSQINEVIRLFLSEYQKSLSEVMTEIGEKAQKRGLTPEILAELLEDE